jgi:hypothetical protein
MLFWDKNCVDCPVAKAGYPGCNGSPYTDYTIAINERTTIYNIVEICDREIKFLEKLRDKHLEEVQSSRPKMTHYFEEG